jgi:hypothetical protein
MTKNASAFLDRHGCRFAGMDAGSQRMTKNAMHFWIDMDVA